MLLSGFHTGVLAIAGYRVWASPVVSWRMGHGVIEVVACIFNAHRFLYIVLRPNALFNTKAYFAT